MQSPSSSRPVDSAPSWRSPRFARLARLGAVTYALVACSNVPVDETRGDNRFFSPRGAIRGSVRFEGPRPCSRRGRVVGAAVVLAYNKDNPPPPAGVARAPVNFTVVPGDELFPNEPRYTGDSLSCPLETEQVVVSTSFEIGPLDGGTYVLSAFYDRTGDFLPSFLVRNQPKQGDVGGGYIDTEAARANAQNPNFRNVFLPIDVGLADGNGGFTIPPQGYVVESILVSLFQRVPLPRPYFHVDGAPTPRPTPSNPEGDPALGPVITMTQDHQVKALPDGASAATVRAFEDSFVSVRLNASLPSDEVGPAVDPREPFALQLEPGVPAPFLLYQRSDTLPESNGVPELWPKVAFTRLVDAALDPQSIAAARPTVVLNGISLLDDALAETTDAKVPKRPGAPRDRLRALIRPGALCLPRGARQGVWVTPAKVGKSADNGADRALFDEAKLLASLGGLAKEVRTACLPLGRYAISLQYSTGQSWTVPNEAGSCATLEGVPNAQGRCSLKDRAILPSQGPKAVLEIVPPTTPEGQAFCDGAGAVPAECQ